MGDDADVVDEGEGGTPLVESSALAERRQLMRKVAQLTKVVMHLTSKNDESEQRYHEVAEELELEVRLS